MPSWKGVLDRLNEMGGIHDFLRRQYLSEIHEITGRNVIAYYSGWLQQGSRANQGIPYEINDSDKNAFMATIHQLDRTLGLDLILHTPGGDVAATESIIDYLRSMFGKNIRAIVPQIAMSAGTIIALSCKEILMAKHSNIGPVDPQIGGMPAHAIINEFQQAVNQIATQPASAPLWQVIFGKMPPTMITAATNAVAMAEEMVRDNLLSCMFEGQHDGLAKADAIIEALTKNDLTKTHSRHISKARAEELKIVVTAIEDDQKLQDAILSVHHCFIHTLASTPVFKITENQNGIAYVQTM